MMNDNIFWIGIQESEIADTGNLFTGSITVFGSGKNGNYAFDKEYQLRYDHNQDNALWFDFANTAAEKIISLYPDCKFLLYYPMEKPFYGETINSRVIGINDVFALDLWDNKFKCREWLCNDVPTIPCEISSGEKIIADSKIKLNSGHIVVIQGEYSCGGSETWLLTEKSQSIVIPRIQPSRLYSLSPYLENSVSVNIHIVVYSDEVLLLPASVQIIALHSYSFEYQGADFITYQHLPEDIKEKVNQFSRIIGERLRRSGYRGVCGIDFITTQNEVYFEEINPRFQSSSFLLNAAFNDIGQELSVQRLHLDAFESATCQKSPDISTVNYSYYKLLYSAENKIFLQTLAERARNFSEITYIDDDYSESYKLEENTYLYKLVFKQNISAVSCDFRLIIQANLCARSIVDLSNWEKHVLELKIMLLSHGVTVHPEVLEYMRKWDGINCEEFGALDLTVNDIYFINVPYLVGLTELSPFQIKFVNHEMWLYYCDDKLLPVMIRGIDPLASKKTKSEIAYSDIAYLGHDRLRIFHRLGCFFKENSLSCRFCDIDNCTRHLSLQTIKEVIDEYGDNTSINHYMIGGGAQAPRDDFSFICAIANYLNKKDNKPIYLMSLPPENEQILIALKQSGITQVAFNIEIYNRELAKLYMPGKGQIPLHTYLNALHKAVDIWGNTGNVRTIFIVGLEPKESLLAGIEQICKMGVSPILSLFKPIINTPLSHMLPPSDEDVLEIVVRTEQLCNQYGVPFGPSCRYCEDNTLKITRQLED